MSARRARRPAGRAAAAAPPEPAPRDATRLALGAGAAVALLLAPTLAGTPQSGDGAEIVNAAVQGGVLHPPGFPLQAWIDRALVAFPGPPARAIAALGLACHAAAAGVIAAILRQLAASRAAALFGAAAFALWPSAWRLAVEPEVFVPAHLMTAVALLVAVRGARAAAPSPLAAGLAGGMGAATHPVFVAALPALAAAAAGALAPAARRVPRAAVWLAALVVPPLALYASLPLLRTASPWPDWGALAGPADVMRHVLRLEYGGLAMSAAQGEASESGLLRWAADTARVWNAGIALAIAGAASLASRGGGRAAFAVLGTFAASLALLAAARLPHQTYTASELERLQGPAVVAGAILLGLGADVLRRRLAPARVRRGFDVLLALAAAAWLVTGWRGADAARDRTLALHQQGVAMEIGDAVYVTEGDAETFSGIPAEGGGRRFPIQGPEMAFEWYWRSVAPRLEPRVLADRTPPGSWVEFLAACFERGLPIASTSRAAIATNAGEPELRGLLYVARPGTTRAFTDSTIAAAVRLAPLAKQLPVLPPGRRELSRFYTRRFARAFSGAGEALRLRGGAATAAGADSVAGAILRGLPARERDARIDAFVASVR